MVVLRSGVCVPYAYKTGAAAGRRVQPEVTSNHLLSPTVLCFNDESLMDRRWEGVPGDGRNPGVSLQVTITIGIQSKLNNTGGRYQNRSCINAFLMASGAFRLAFAIFFPGKLARYSSMYNTKPRNEPKTLSLRWAESEWQNTASCLWSPEPALLQFKSLLHYSGHYTVGKKTGLLVWQSAILSC